jgi:hypothetical protein
MKIRWDTTLYGKPYAIVGEVQPRLPGHPAAMTRFTWTDPETGRECESSVPTRKLQELYFPGNSDSGIQFEGENCCRCSQYRGGSCDVLLDAWVKSHSVEWVLQDREAKCLRFSNQPKPRRCRKYERREKRGQLNLFTGVQPC